MRFLNTPKHFRIFLSLSIILHALLFAFIICAVVKDPFFWGGGLSGQLPVVMVELEESRQTTIEGEGLKIESRQPAPKKEKESPAFGEGNSPTPEGGKGTGFDAVTGQNRSPDVLALIRQRIIRAKSYPLAARRRGIEGTVKILFRISQEGGIEKVGVISSSGFTLLDDEAVATVKRGAPYPYYEGDISMGLTFDLRE